MKIIFLGNTNNIVYAIARKLHEKNYDVTFLVDLPKEFLLDRPESYDTELAGKYPPWIKEMIVKNPLKGFKMVFTPIFLRKFVRLLNEYDVIFLNGLWISIGRYIRKEKLVIDVFAGFDLDFTIKSSMSDYLKAFYKVPLRRIFPAFAVKSYYRKFMAVQEAGIRRANVINYYPEGINPLGDEKLREIKANQHYQRLQLRGLDCGQFPYKEPGIKRDKFVILNITRFYFLNDRNDNKRNDLMIKGIAEFIRKNRISEKLEIIFFEKGEDLEIAKRMCAEEGLEPFVQWHRVVSVDRLYDYFADCDVAFDQLGKQWIGAGLFSMLVGRPLIANGRPEIFERLTRGPLPVCQATSVEEVCSWLTKLYLNKNLIKEIGIQSRDYVLQHYELEKTVEFYERSFKEFYKSEDKPMSLPANKFME